MTLLELQQTNQRFGGLHALKEINLQISEGEIVGVIGPNGAGKSTLFNTVIGLTPATSGTITFAERNVTRLSTHEIISLGLVKTSQHVQVFGEMSVHDNVIVGTILHTPSLREARELAFKELEFLGLSHLAAASASDLTLASRARLELARALSLKPRLLMIDELMAGMSEVEVSEMLDLLKRINQERHVTLLVIEHNMRAIMKLSQRIIALIQGSLAADGDPQVVSHDPTVVEAYLGVV
jgi:branched-chain amino acid transport system ATP-binding protein